MSKSSSVSPPQKTRTGESIKENPEARKTAKVLLDERIFSQIGLENYTAWEDSAGNTMTYCCLDMSARDYSKFGLLFNRDGRWEDKQIISKDYVDESLQLYWGATPDMGWSHSDTRGYSLQWWISKYDDDAKIYNTNLFIFNLFKIIID